MISAVLLLVVAPGAQSSIDAGQEAREILERGNYQRELPRDGDSREAPDGEAEGSKEDERRRPREEDANGGRVREPGSGRIRGGSSLALPPEVAAVIGGLLFAALVVGIATWLVRSRGGADVRLGERRAREPEAEGVAVFDELPLDAAERLAREGRFAEAIRTLLRLTFQALRGREGVRLEPWLTGREVLGAARLSDGQRASLGELVGAVERSLFARRVPGREEYEACVREYRALLAGDGGAVRA